MGVNKVWDLLYYTRAFICMTRNWLSTFFAGINCSMLYRPHAHRTVGYISFNLVWTSACKVSTLICLSTLVKHDPVSAYANAETCCEIHGVGCEGRPRLTAVIWCYLWNQISLNMSQYSSTTWKLDLSTVITFISNLWASLSIAEMAHRN